MPDHHDRQTINKLVIPSDPDAGFPARIPHLTRRRVLMFGLPVTLVALGLGGWQLWPQPQSAINLENAAKIQVGMTLAEVEAILGGPARGESSGPIVPDLPEDGTLEESGAAYLFLRIKGRSRFHQVWTSDNLVIRMDFDPEWQVVSCKSRSVRRYREGPLAMLRRWLDL